LAIRWSVAQQYIKNIESFDCDFCQKQKDLKNRRNCGWIKPGECKTCGSVPFESVEVHPRGMSFICPACGGRVRFGSAAEFILGKYVTPGCPKSMIAERAVFLIQLVNWSEKVGVLPTADVLLNESLFYFEVRNFVVTETSVAEEEIRPKEKS